MPTTGKCGEKATFCYEIAVKAMQVATFIEQQKIKINLNRRVTQINNEM